MDKINYNQHDWSKGEVIKEENLDNMENGIKQATNKINEIIDTEQDFQDRMTGIDERIDINNEELFIARDGCDNLGQRIERDQQYIYNILNDGSYLEFNGTDIDINNAKEGYTSNMVIKGQTYQNLIKFNTVSKNTENTGYYFLSRENKNLYKTGDYTIINNSNKKIVLSICDNSDNWVKDITIDNGKTKISLQDRQYVYALTGLLEDGWDDSNKDDLKLSSTILEGDWTNKEVPNTYINGIESVGERENNKISILSHSKNLATIATKGNTNFTVGYIKQGKTYTISFEGNRNGLKLVYYYNNSPREQIIGNVWNNIASFTSQKDCMLYINSYKGQTLTNIMLVEGNYNSDTMPKFELPKEDKKEILLPIEGGLKSLPNGICDTIEQREDGIYLVQRIGKRILNGSEGWGHNEFTPNQNNTMCFNSANVVPIENVLISDKFNFLNTSDFDNSDFECITSDVSEPYGLMIRINKNVLKQQNVNGFREWLQANPTTVYYELATPIETKLDIDTLNLQVFKDKTYILSKNNIKPEIVCKAPVDVNQTIADLQEEQEQLIETYNTLKEENEAVKTAISELNEQGDVQTADMLDLDMRVLALEEGLE